MQLSEAQKITNPYAQPEHAMIKIAWDKRVVLPMEQAIQLFALIAQAVEVDKNMHPVSSSDADYGFRPILPSEIDGLRVSKFLGDLE